MKKIGDINSLNTKSKNIVGAINEAVDDEWLMKIKSANDTLEIGLDLNDVKYNIITYTGSSHQLLNLPPMLDGNSGIFMCFATTSNYTTAYHCVQYFYHFGSTSQHYSLYSRMYNGSVNTWSEWSHEGGTRIINYKDIDLNNLTNNGTYYVASGMTNGPNNLNGACYIEVLSRSNTYVYQRCIQNVNTDEYLPKFERTCFNGTWTAWRYL